MTYFQLNTSTKPVLTLNIVIALLFLFSSCKNNKYEDVLAVKQYEYQPLAIGNYTIFDVDSTHYNFINPSTQQTDTFHFQQMERISDTMYDNEGGVNYRFELFRRADATATWRLWKVWYGLTTSTSFERQEDDLRFAKLIFPPTADVHWNGNKYVPAIDSNAAQHGAMRRPSIPHQIDGGSGRAGICGQQQGDPGDLHRCTRGVGGGESHLDVAARNENAAHCAALQPVAGMDYLLL